MTEEKMTDCATCARREAEEIARRKALESRWVRTCYMLSECFDRWRLMPRALVGMYGYVCYDVHVWYKALEAPTSEQQMYANIIWGAAAVWFGLYVSSGKGGRLSHQDKTNGD